MLKKIKTSLYISQIIYISVIINLGAYHIYSTKQHRIKRYTFQFYFHYLNFIIIIFLLPFLNFNIMYNHHYPFLH
jgi:hypothetical protein